MNATNSTEVNSAVAWPTSVWASTRAAISQNRAPDRAWTPAVRTSAADPVSRWRWPEARRRRPCSIAGEATVAAPRGGVPPIAAVPPAAPPGGAHAILVARYVRRVSEAITYPGARRPDRQRRVDSHGLAIAVHEWGDESDPPILLAHGGMDFAGTFDVFAPMLAAEGFRVVSWDHRGHGDSQHAALYNWEADLRDAVMVFDSVTPTR